MGHSFKMKSSYVSARRMGSENEETMELQAEHLFLLMKKDYRISRNARAEWYFNHLNHTVQIPKADKVEHFKGELEIISAIPQETPLDWDWDTSHLYQYAWKKKTCVILKGSLSLLS